MITTLAAISIPQWLTDLGTIGAGFAATAVLGVDIYTRLCGAKPNPIAFIDATKINDDICFYLVIKNIGNAPAYLDALETAPDWTTLSSVSGVNPLLLAKDHLLFPHQSLTLPMNLSTIENLLENFYSNEKNLKSPYYIEVNLTSHPAKTCIFRRKKPKTQHFRINLTSVYMSKLPLHRIIPDEELQQSILDFMNAFRL